MAPPVTTLRKRAPSPSPGDDVPTFCSLHPERCQSSVASRNSDDDDDDDDDDEDDDEELTSTSSHSASTTRTSSSTRTTSASVSASTTASATMTSITSSITSTATSSATSTSATSATALAASASATSSKSHSSTNKGAIAGGVVGAFVIIAALFFLLVFLFRRRIRKRLAPSAEFIHHTGQPPASPFAPAPPAADMHARDPEMGEAGALDRHPSLLTPGKRQSVMGRLSTDEPPPFTPGGYATTGDEKLERTTDGSISREALENDHGYGGYGVGVGRG